MCPTSCCWQGAAQGHYCLCLWPVAVLPRVPVSASPLGPELTDKASAFAFRQLSTCLGERREAGAGSSHYSRAEPPASGLPHAAQ